jgi:hypothetical protein
VDADNYSFTLFLLVFRESALLATRAMVRAPLQAAAGQATAVKLQTNRKRPFSIIKAQSLENSEVYTFLTRRYLLNAGLLLLSR